MRDMRISMLITVATLLAIGTVMVYSSSGIYAHERYNDSLFFLKRQIFFLCVGTLAALAAMIIDYRTIQRFAKPIFLVSLVFLVMVLISAFGTEVSGAKRWFRIGNFSFQPSAFAKLSLMIYLADVLSRKKPYINDLTYGILPPFLVSGLTIGLILIQPDLGTAIAIGSVALILFFIAGVRWEYIAGGAVAAIPILYLLIYRVEYRWKRILVFLNPWRDSQGSGFQIIQSFLALGSGGIFGVGLGMSRQKLLYLPASHTDFIFSIIGEELGFLGTASVVMLFMALIWQGMRIVLESQDLFGRFLSLGITSLFAIESIINIGVSTGTLPTKGLPLPFISYGGSALVFHMIEVGLLLNIARSSRR